MTNGEIDQLREKLRQQYISEIERQLSEVDNKVEHDIQRVIQLDKQKQKMINEFRGKLVRLDSHSDYFIFEDVELSEGYGRVIGKTGLYYNGGSCGKTFNQCLTLTDNYSRYTTDCHLTLKENDRDWFNEMVEYLRKKRKGKR